MTIQIIFYVFASILLFSGIMVIGSRNPVNSALFLVLAFFASAGLWILAEAEFLALILILVYVGAVMTLFLFVVMMLNLGDVPRQAGFVGYLPMGLLIMLALVAMMLLVVGPKQFGIAHITVPVAQPADYSNVKELGRVLYTTFALPFEMAGVLLLVAMLSAVSLTHRGTRDRQVQQPGEQIKVRAKDRIRLVDIPTEPKPGKPSS